MDWKFSEYILFVILNEGNLKHKGRHAFYEIAFDFDVSIYKLGEVFL